MYERSNKYFRIIPEQFLGNHFIKTSSHINHIHECKACREAGEITNRYILYGMEVFRHVETKYHIRNKENKEKKEVRERETP